MRQPQPAKLSNNANVDHTPSPWKPEQVSMVRCGEKSPEFVSINVPGAQPSGTHRMRWFQRRL
jgi:hypothetical protein